MSTMWRSLSRIGMREIECERSSFIRCTSIGRVRNAKSRCMISPIALSSPLPADESASYVAVGERAVHAVVLVDGKERHSPGMHTVEAFKGVDKGFAVADSKWPYVCVHLRFRFWI